MYADKTILNLLHRFNVGCIICCVASPQSASAYPINCAILLYMAGEFPASAECTAAKAEVIRRTTPITVESPLQLWNYPMRMDPSLARAISMTQAALDGLGRDGLTSEV